MHHSVVYFVILHTNFVVEQSVNVKKEPSCYFMLKERITKTIELYYF